MQSILRKGLINNYLLNQKGLLYLKAISTTRNFLTSPFPELSQFSQTFKDRAELHKFSIQNRDEFWSIIARNRIDWINDFTAVTSNNQIQFSSDKNHDYKIDWFLNGKLNISVNCVDRHYLKNPNKIALIWERDEPGTEEYVTYK
jgi:acetyl-CoA synthetase